MNFKSEFQHSDQLRSRLRGRKMPSGKPSSATLSVAKGGSAGRFSGGGAERQLHPDERQQQQHHDRQIEPDGPYRELRNEPAQRSEEHTSELQSHVNLV